MLVHYLRRPLGPANVRWARIAPPRTRVGLTWNYWWQAQLLDCLVDAHRRAPSRARAARIRGLARGIWWRNGGRWLNEYHDDIAWLGLALHRAGRHPRAVRVIVARLLAAWVDDERGGIPWRRGDVFRNAPAAGPAAILLARRGHPVQATRLADWIHGHLTRPDGLIADGERDGGRIEPTAYTYNQGVTLGADQAVDRIDRIPPLVEAVSAGLSRDGVLAGHGTGDGGLFTGILIRYLGGVAADARVPHVTRATATELVRASAEAAWQQAEQGSSGPRFGPDWTVAGPPAADLSVQLGAWMALEAAARLDRDRPDRI